MSTVKQELLAALKAAKAHLDYCGYGDRWERECARAKDLEGVITRAIASAEGEASADDRNPCPFGGALK